MWKKVLKSFKKCQKVRFLLSIYWLVTVSFRFDFSDFSRLFRLFFWLFLTFHQGFPGITLSKWLTVWKLGGRCLSRLERMQPRLMDCGPPTFTHLNQDGSDQKGCILGVHIPGVTVFRRDPAETKGVADPPNHTGSRILLTVSDGEQVRMRRHL